jgi:hypothetical protein
MKQARQIKDKLCHSFNHLLCNIIPVFSSYPMLPQPRCSANTAKEQGLPQPGMKIRLPKCASGEVAPGIAPI